MAEAGEKVKWHSRPVCVDERTGETPVPPVPPQRGQNRLWCAQGHPSIECETRKCIWDRDLLRSRNLTIERDLLLAGPHRGARDQPNSARWRFCLGNEVAVPSPSTLLVCSLVTIRVGDHSLFLVRDDQFYRMRVVIDGLRQVDADDFGRIRLHHVNA